MSEAAKELSLIRKYLLGRLQGEEREQLEERVMLDPEFRDRVLLVEENLIEDYAEGALDATERQNFRTMFYANPERRLESQMVEGLKEHAKTQWRTRLFQAVQDKIFFLRPDTADGERATDATPTVIPSKVDSLWSFRKTAVALALVVIVVLAFLILQRLLRSRSPNLEAQQQQRSELIERELARLNDPASHLSQPLSATATTLRPGLSRGHGQEPANEFPTVAVPHGAESTQFILLLKPSSDQYKNFQATLSPLSAPESFQVDLKPAALGAGERALVLMLPAHVLADGDYSLQLIGHTSGGKTAPLPDHYYYFRLVRQ
jgi:hypothetical protein